MFSLDFCLRKIILGPSPMHDKFYIKHIVQKMFSSRSKDPIQKVFPKNLIDIMSSEIEGLGFSLVFLTQYKNGLSLDD